MSDDTGAGAAGAGGEGAGGGAGGKWFEGDRWQGDAKTFIEAKGLSKFEDPNEAISHLIGMGQAADKRFGRPLDSVIDKPGADQPLTEWRRQNASVFGLPEAADGYAVERPGDLPDTIAWDSDLEGKFRQVAFDRGFSQDDVQALTGLYAEQVKTILRNADSEAERANAAMMEDLKKTYGVQLDQVIATAQQAAQVIGERAGLDAGGIQAVAATLTKATGSDAAAIRFFSALGDLMGEAPGLGFGKGGGAGMSASEAQAKLAELRGKGGAFFEAKTAAERSALMPEIERLTKIAMGGNG